LQDIMHCAYLAGGMHCVYCAVGLKCSTAKGFLRLKNVQGRWILLYKTVYFLIYQRITLAFIT
jgi:hypothetical protein